MQKKTNSPRARLMERKFINGFDPFNPKDELIDIIGEIKLPRSGYLNTAMRGKYLIELSLEQLEYYAFDLKAGDEKNKMLSKLYYFIRLVGVMDKERLSKDDILMMMEDVFAVKTEELNSDKLDF